MKTILFDFDGTLLKMDQDAFVKSYFGRIAAYFKDVVDPKVMIDAISKGTYKMVVNDGTKTNEEVFLSVFEALTGLKADDEMFNQFYLDEFPNTVEACEPDGKARVLIDILKAKGYRLVLATNPLFPRIATLTRMGFVDLKEEDFALVTTYDNSSYCKPNLKYYEEIMQKLDIKPEECIMVGNDCDEDMVINELGVDFYLITDNLINKHNKDIKAKFVGSLDEFIELAKNTL